MLNDLIRTYKKIILAVVLILCAILVWFFGCHRFAGNKDGETEWKQTAKDELIYEFTTPQTSGSIIFGTCGHLTADRIQPVGCADRHFFSLLCLRESRTDHSRT